MLLRSMLCLAGATLASAQSQDRFPAREHIQPGFADDIAIAAGDLDGDGRDDLVVTSGLPILHVYLGKATYGIEPAGTLDIETPAVALDLGDVDADGFLDIAFSTSNKVFVALGKGTGGVSPPSPVGFINGGESLELADIEGDGSLDLLVLSSMNAKIKCFLSAGNGQFYPPVTSTMGKTPLDLAAADLDADGLVDIVLASSGNSRLISARGLGNGEFAVLQSTKIQLGKPTSVTLGELSGDGIIDIVFGMELACGGAVCLGTGDGGFGFPKSFTGGSSIALARWNADSTLDLACACPFQGIHVVTTSLGGNPSGISAVSGPFKSRAIVSCDTNGDGFDDLAYGAVPDLPPSQQFGDPVLLVGVVNGSPGPEPLHLTAIRDDDLGWIDARGRAEDLDADGLLDAVGFESGVDGGLFVRRADGNGGLGPAEFHSLPLIQQVEIADVNGDGLPDLIAGALEELFVLTSAGAHFDPASISATAYLHRFCSGDVDMDGMHDVIALTKDGLELRLSVGDGEFGTPITTAVPPGLQIPLDPQSGLFAILDLDGDPTREFLVSDTANNLHSFRVQPNGQLSYWSTTRNQGAWTAASKIDLDQDGIDDLVVGPSMSTPPGTPSTIVALKSDGRGGFEIEQSVVLGPGALGIETADIDGDGHSDLLVLLAHGQMAWVRADGRGGFDAPIRYAAAGHPFGLGDLDGDGRCDLLAFPVNPAGATPPGMQFKAIYQR